MHPVSSEAPRQRVALEAEAAPMNMHRASSEGPRKRARVNLGRARALVKRLELPTGPV
jgi:hypothetical protein